MNSPAQVSPDSLLQRLSAIEGSYVLWIYGSTTTGPHLSLVFGASPASLEADVKKLESCSLYVTDASWRFAPNNEDPVVWKDSDLFEQRVQPSLIKCHGTRVIKVNLSPWFDLTLEFENGTVFAVFADSNAIDEDCYSYFSSGDVYTVRKSRDCIREVAVLCERGQTLRLIK